MPELMNWPPSRGTNPHTHDWKWTPGASAKDMPAPKQKETAVIEKDLIKQIEQKPAKATAAPPLKPIYYRNLQKKKPLLVGTWKVWCQVEAVAGLTLQQADELILVCRDDCKKTGHHHDQHLDNWFDFEPRPLWVDITYPLTRGVRLLVKPLIRESVSCKACEKKFGKERHKKQAIMSPGYFLWMVAKEYERIYKAHQKYGVWGHALSDLGFERITIRKDGVVDLYIGS